MGVPRPDGAARAVGLTPAPVDVCADAELGDGEARVVDVGGEPVAVVRSGGRLYAFADICSHEECALSDGMMSDREIECPCHGSIFDMRTGEALTGPALASVRVYRVAVEAGRVVVGP